MKKIWLSVSGGLSFLIFLILLLVSNHMASGQKSQQMAERWSEKKDAAQISCFFSPNAEVTPDTIKAFEYTIDNALSEASVVQESENPGARLWADAYSADGKITMANAGKTLEADAIGVGGDFFLFHPLQLVSGTYFSGHDVMQDYCVLDEDAAWQLFGSDDIAGMTVTIGGIPHIITGVVEREQGRLAKAAGLDSTLVYVSYKTLSELGKNNGINHYEIVMPNPVKNFALNHRLAKAAGLDSTLVYVSYKTLSELGKNNGINHYEIVMPNPVKNFALNHVKENIGAEEKEAEILENTSRYSVLSRLKLIGKFGTRSMNGKAIIYPYWENIARGYEDIIAVLTVVMLLFLLYPGILVIVSLIWWWKHKGWTIKDVWHIARGYEDIIAVLTVVMLLFLLYPGILVIVSLIWWWKHKGWTIKDVWHWSKDKLERKMEASREKKKMRREKGEHREKRGNFPKKKAKGRLSGRKGGEDL